MDTSKTNRESATISHKDKLVQMLPAARRRKVSCRQDFLSEEFSDHTYEFCKKLIEMYCFRDVGEAEINADLSAAW